ncbi:MAG: radical SAM family heme chaperone HemW [Candidatus Cloacimonetes bacterium]|nr:radical SAM family heme chaperone HemW [Candidatus Cloacimonadota bacterium]
MRKEIEQIRHFYIHVPFCLSKCGYCSFYSKEPEAGEIDNYCRTLIKEIAYYRTNKKLALESIYFGGGTPSLLSKTQIESILNELTFDSACEVTIEANPGDVNPALADVWLQAGINRISIGLQSMQPEELRILGRRHGVEENYAAVNTLRESGFTNISFDLIYGLPQQSLADVKYSLEEYMKLSPEHLSTYCLSLADDCRLAYLKKQLPDDETESEMYYMIRQVLQQNGWQQYELSSFSRNNRHSVHNSAYWQSREYVGCGPSASGYISGIRYQNSANLNLWREQVLSGRFMPNNEEIDETLREKEYIILALRTTQGFKSADFKKEFKIDFREKYSEKLVKFQNLKLLELADGYIRLTPEGYFISNEVLSEFV